MRVINNSAKYRAAPAAKLAAPPSPPNGSPVVRNVKNNVKKSASTSASTSAGANATALAGVNRTGSNASAETDAATRRSAFRFDRAVHGPPLAWMVIGGVPSVLSCVCLVVVLMTCRCVTAQRRELRAYEGLPVILVRA